MMFAELTHLHNYCGVNDTYIVDLNIDAYNILHAWAICMINVGLAQDHYNN